MKKLDHFLKVEKILPSNITWTQDRCIAFNEIMVIEADEKPIKMDDGLLMYLLSNKFYGYTKLINCNSFFKVYKMVNEFYSDNKKLRFNPDQYTLKNGENEISVLFIYTRENQFTNGFKDYIKLLIEEKYNVATIDSLSVYFSKLRCLIEVYKNGKLDHIDVYDLISIENEFEMEKTMSEMNSKDNEKVEVTNEREESTEQPVFEPGDLLTALWCEDLIKAKVLTYTKTSQGYIYVCVVEYKDFIRHLLIDGNGNPLINIGIDCKITFTKKKFIYIIDFKEGRVEEVVCRSDNLPRLYFETKEIAEKQLNILKQQGDLKVILD